MSWDTSFNALKIHSREKYLRAGEAFLLRSMLGFCDELQASAQGSALELGHLMRLLFVAGLEGKRIRPLTKQILSSFLLMNHSREVLLPRSVYLVLDQSLPFRSQRLEWRTGGVLLLRGDFTALLQHGEQI